VRGRLKHQAAGAADDGSRSFGGNQLDVEVTADDVATRGEDLERGDDIERIEAIEQDDLCVHGHIVARFVVRR
jgi:hypothetical protein